MEERVVRSPFGFIPLRKEPGRTSAQCGYAIRARLHEMSGFGRKPKDLALGHFGTLDPQATGILPLAVGKATRLFTLIHNRTKVYTFDLCLGRSTSTGDAEGQTLCESAVPAQPERVVEAVLPHFRGAIEQLPPMVSAVHHEGRRLYELAREGKIVTRKLRAVHISSLELLAVADARLSMRVHCSEGTYVRSLCEDIAVAAGMVGHMDALVREAAGPFTLDQSVSFEAVMDDPMGALIDPRKFIELPTVALDEAEQAIFARGMAQTLATQRGDLPQVFALAGSSADAAIIGYGSCLHGRLVPARVFT